MGGGVPCPRNPDLLKQKKRVHATTQASAGINFGHVLQSIKPPFHEYAPKIRMHILIITFYEEIIMHINSQEMFSLPKELESGGHAGNLSKIDRLDSYTDDERRVGKQ